MLLQSLLAGFAVLISLATAASMSTMAPAKAPIPATVAGRSRAARHRAR